MNASDDLVLAWYTRRAIEGSSCNCSAQHICLIGELSCMTNKLDEHDIIDHLAQAQPRAWVHA